MPEAAPNEIRLPDAARAALNAAASAAQDAASRMAQVAKAAKEQCRPYIMEAQQARMRFDVMMSDAMKALGFPIDVRAGVCLGCGLVTPGEADELRPQAMPNGRSCPGCGAAGGVAGEAASDPGQD